MKLKRIICLFMMLFLLCPLYAFADDSGVLAESELNEWVVKVLRDSAAGQPINAPVGEESHTEDGYAFIYDFATLYYDKPVLDQDSVLLAVSVTDEAYPGPRGIKLGDAQSVLIDTYGWQNPTLVGDGIFAAFYRLNSLPQSAYWSWAQLDGAGAITGVQCAIHVQVSDGRYTDAGVVYSLEGGVVTAIRVYGLSSFISADEVRGNLEAVESVQTAASGDAVDDVPDVTLSAATVAANQAQPFGLKDLSFSGMDYATLTLEGAKAALGNLYQVSNQVTLGRTEQELISAVTAVGHQLIDMERTLRDKALAGGRINLEDAVYRAWGLMTHARLMPKKEFFAHWSNLRLGAATKLLAIPLERVDALLTDCQDAHLCAWEEAALEGTALDQARAKRARMMLAG